MANAPQKDSAPSDDELFEYYLSILPPFLNIDTTTDRNEPTATSVSGHGKSKIREWVDEDRVPSKMVDGKRKIQTFGLLKLLFSSPYGKPTQLAHAPLEGRQYRRPHKRIAPQIPGVKRRPGRPRKYPLEQVAARRPAGGAASNSAATGAQ